MTYRLTKCGREFALVNQTAGRTAWPDHLSYTEHTLVAVTAKAAAAAAAAAGVVSTHQLKFLAVSQAGWPKHFSVGWIYKIK